MKKFPFTTLSYSFQSQPRLIDLLRITRDEGHALRHTAKFWRWKHLENPFGKSYGIYGWDEKREMVVGLRMLMSWFFKDSNSSETKAARAVDTATHPEYQRKGIFYALTKRALSDLKKKGTKFIFNVPNEKSLPGYIKLGWRVVAKWPLYSLALKNRRFETQIKEEKDFFKSSIIKWSDFQKLQGDKITGLIQGWENKRKQVGYRTARDLTYFNWRYGACPNPRYWVYFGENIKSPEGMAILRPRVWQGLRVAAITDIFLLDSNQHFGLDFLRKLSGELRVNNIVAYFARGTFEENLLRRADFAIVPVRQITFAVRLLNPACRNALRSKNWDLSLGDLELF